MPAYDDYQQDDVQRPGARAYAADTAMPPRYAPGTAQGGGPGPGGQRPGGQGPGGHAPGGQGPGGRTGQNAPADTYPYSETGAYAGPEAYREPVNGGAYAYVIRDDEEFAPRARPTADQAPGPGRPSQHGRRSRGEPLSLGPPPAALGVDAQGETSEPPSSDTAVAYGPDDPAYGPPGRDWYEREEEARRKESEEELSQARGPFEPLPPDHEVTAPAPPSFDPIGLDAADDQPQGFPDRVPGTADGSVGDAGVQRSGDLNSDVPDGDLTDGDLTDDLDVALVGQGTGPLDRIKDLYVTAESIGERRLDKHFEQLLERQRQLISDYFTNQEYRRSTSAGQRPAGQGAVPDPNVPGDRLDGVGGPAGPTSPAGPESERLSLRGARRSAR